MAAVSCVIGMFSLDWLYKFAAASKVGEIKLFDLRKPIYLETAAYGHMGREPKKVKKTFINSEKKSVEFDLELFNWEKLDYVDKIKKLFKLA